MSMMPCEPLPRTAVSLGKGAYAQVFTQAGDSRVAIKVLCAPTGDGDLSISRELQVLQQCQHTNLVHLLRMGSALGARPPGWDHDEEPFAWFSMPRATCSLYQALRGSSSRWKGSVCAATMRTILQGVSEGLRHMHDSSFMHRDIKSANVLLYGRDHAVLCDFGLSRSYDDVRANTSIRLTNHVVTRMYRPPELLAEGDYRAHPWAVDWWSFGVLAYECFRAAEKTKGSLDLVGCFTTLQSHRAAMGANQYTLEQQLGETGRGTQLGAMAALGLLHDTRPAPRRTAYSHFTDAQRAAVQRLGWTESTWGSANATSQRAWSQLTEQQRADATAVWVGPLEWDTEAAQQHLSMLYQQANATAGKAATTPFEARIATLLPNTPDPLRRIALMCLRTWPQARASGEEIRDAFLQCAIA